MYHHGTQTSQFLVNRWILNAFNFLLELARVLGFIFSGEIRFLCDKDWWCALKRWCLLDLVFTILIDKKRWVNVDHVSFSLLSFYLFSWTELWLFWQVFRLRDLLFLLWCRCCAFTYLLTYNLGKVWCIVIRDGARDRISVAFLNEQITFSDNICCSDMFIYTFMNNFISCILIDINNDFGCCGVLQLLSLLIERSILVNLQLRLILVRFI